MKSRRIVFSAGLVVVFGLVAFSFRASGQSNVVIIEPRADTLLKQMSETLAKTKEFSFESSALIDEISTTGQKIQFSKRSTAFVRRPNMAYAEVKGDRENYRFTYDGKAVYLLDPKQNQYSIAEAPANLDATLDMLAEKYGLVVALADVLFSDPYRAMTDRLQAGVYLDVHDVNGTPCHHLAFRQQAVDWQIWIEQGDRPLPRKLVITYKQIPGEPQFTAFLDKWNLQPKLTDDQFKFVAPAGAKKVDLIPVVPAEAAKP